MTIDDIESPVSRETGWKSSPPGGEGLFFALEKGPGLSSSLLGNIPILSFHLLPIHPGENERDGLARALSSLVAASFPRRPSVLSVWKGSFFLHRALPLRRLSEEELMENARGFLNEKGFFIKNLPGERSR